MGQDASKYSTLDDSALMASIADKDELALGALYERYAPTVLGLCRYILKDRVLAEDVLEDVFWELWDKSDRYRSDRATPRTYLLMLGRSRAIDRLRSEKQHRTHTVHTTTDDQLDPAPTTRDSTPGPLRDVVAGELREQLSEALGTLDPEVRTVVELSFYEGLSHSKIADRLEQPLGTVKTRIRQGLIRLRDILRTYYGSETRS